MQLDHTLSQKKADYIFEPYLLKVSFNVILPRTRTVGLLYSVFAFELS
jgi:hypothetical protein